MEDLAWLEPLALDADELRLALAYAAVEGAAPDPDDVRAATRRAVLLLAAGGDPHRDLDPDGRAVAAVAADLDTGALRTRFRAELETVRRRTEAPKLLAAAAELLADEPRAWRLAALAVLAAALVDE